ncbi:MAG: DUF5655 domain-containing protein [Acidimicrobiales bacterium]
MSLEEYFADAKPWERPIYDVVNGHLSELEGGDLIVDPIAMGIMFKNGPMICELRTKTKWTALGFSLARKLSSKKLSRKVVAYAPSGKFFHVINVSDPEQIDDEILDWLTEAYYLPLGGRPPEVSDPMVPDDIDDDFFD